MKTKLRAGDWAAKQKYPLTSAKVRKFSTMQLAEMCKMGIKHVGVLGSPNPGENCEACEAIMFIKGKDGVKFEIEFASPLPLPGCNKKHCKCLFIAR
jgi:hypothetical protein